jgi:ribosomal-protein-alanine N-acetyltransferase
MSPPLELLALEPAEWRALGDDPPAFAAARRMDAGDAVALLREVGTNTASYLVRLGEPGKWGSYLAVDSRSRRIIGTCSYKGPPAADGAVEIAYFTFPGYEGQGYATAMAALLTELAADPPAAGTVRAHTLPERNASVRILEKIGFAHLGEVVEPEDGTVWRWERAPGTIQS